jgi:predicted small integral membrane protein
MSENILLYLEQWLNEIMPWMYWKYEVMLFLIGFFVFLVILAIVSVKRQSNPKMGCLKIPVTLGDKVFISAVTIIAIMLIVLAIGLPWYLIIIIGIPTTAIIFLRG